MHLSAFSVIRAAAALGATLGDILPGESSDADVGVSDRPFG